MVDALTAALARNLCNLDDCLTADCPDHLSTAGQALKFLTAVGVILPIGVTIGAVWRVVRRGDDDGYLFTDRREAERQALHGGQDGMPGTVERPRGASRPTGSTSPALRGPMANDEVISLRVSTDQQETFRADAQRLGLSVSDLLRLGASVVADMTVEQTRQRMACPTCGGSGLRFKAKDGDVINQKETT